MDEELDFLLEDENIIEAEISDVVKNGKTTTGISLTVGMNESQISDLFNLVGEEKLKQIPTAFEIILTKSDLKKINSTIRNYE